MRFISVAVLAALSFAAMSCKAQLQVERPKMIYLGVAECQDGKLEPAINTAVTFDSTMYRFVVEHETIHAQQFEADSTGATCGEWLARIRASADSIVKYEAQAYCYQAYDSANAGGVLPSVQIPTYKQMTFQVIQTVDSLYPYSKVSAGFDSICVSNY